ncbi:CRP/FNR family transcriptional regulator, anaerobic regulatory protein [Jannaschia seohaensis]|uniref:CRP/FNR family transcriptional regulator n=2 Tax=Jannaschia seohaensis TaxID=475081 RepID=A0A2Y9BZN3_9RHOB|nr:CRP/FNR family transcriptional regulator [Jannaschia seohaensis]SSA44672.1 CRP/FNR family transcriptional regulator, anaerobic regulatory protein [Jannaschia seohaensis]
MTRDADKKAQDLKRYLSAFHGIDPRTRATLDVMCRVRSYRAGTTVVRERETAEIVGCVLSGILRMQKTLVDGRRHIVGLLVSGDLFGRVYEGPGEFSIEAATEAHVCTFPKAEFEAFLKRSPDLERAVMLNILNELDRARDWMIILSNQKISSRIAGFLLLLRSRFASLDDLVEEAIDGTKVRIPISRTDLAQLLGTRPESVSRALHALQDDGDIRILEPNLVFVRNFHALARKAGEQDIGGMSSVKDILQEEKRKR